MKLQLLSRAEIDENRWNEAVSADGRGFPYAYTWYLDLVSPGNWEGLVSEDYQYVMPLVGRKLMPGVYRLQVPVLTQQLGVYGQGIDETKVKVFLHALPNRYRLIQLSLKDDCTNFNLRGQFRLRTNLVLDLNQSYENLKARYGRTLRSRVRKAEPKHVLSYSVDATDFLSFYRKHMQDILGLAPAYYERIYALLQGLLERNLGTIYDVRDQAGARGAMAFFFQNEKRIINLISASSPQGRKLNSMHFLLDAAIQAHCEQPKTFDFEGSEIPGVYEFFKSFGSENEPFTVYSDNRLPAPLKMMYHLAKNVRKG